MNIIATREHVTRRPFPVTTLSIGVVLTLTLSACAGSVGKYRNAGISVTDGQAAAPDVGDVNQLAVPSAPTETATESGATALTEPGRTAPPLANTSAPGSQPGSAAQPGGSNAGPAPTSGDSEEGRGAEESPAPEQPPPSQEQVREVGVTPGQVTLGLFYPKTGAYATYARNAELVVQAAFNEVNERGGIHGRKLAVKSYDDGTGDAGTIRANERRARDETFAFLSLISQSNEILAGFVEQDRVPFVAGNISGEQARQLRYTFTPFPYWTTQARILPGFIKNHLRAGDRTIAVVFETSGPAQDAKEVFKATAAEQGLEVVFEQPIDRNQATCANEVNNLQSRNVGVVFVMAGPIGASCMLRDGRTLGYDPIWTGVGASWNLDITATATGGAADGIETLGVAPTLETPVGREFAQVMQKHYPDSGAETEDAMVLIYVMTQFYIEALEQTGQSLTRETFVSAIETKMNGWQTPYVPPPRFGPGDRSGADAVSVTRCCVDGRWVTPDPGWRTSF